MFSLILFTLLCVSPNQVLNAKILGIFPVPSTSHQVVFQPIWRELSLRGHEVIIITPNPLNDSTLINLTEISLSFAYKIPIELNYQAADNHLPVTSVMKYWHNMFSSLLKFELAHSNVQDLINDKTKTFDLIMVQFVWSQAIYALSERFNCAIIGITPSATLTNGHDAVGKPTHPVLNPDSVLPFIDTSGMFERIHSTYYAIWYRLYHHWYILPEQDKIAKKYISKSPRYLGNIERNFDVVLSYENPILYIVSPSVPAFIEICCKSMMKEKLVGDLQEELDSAKNGAIYFSLGSNVKSSKITEELRNTIIESLSELPYRILWKWETDHLPGQPKNVIIRKWFPQQEVLRHPNVKVFFTQGGVQSLEEAIFNGVPIVGMPFFFDQTSNVLRMVRLGIGQAVDTKTLTKKQLRDTIVEVAENPKYRKRVKKVSILMQDVPMTGLKKAIWWIEYVIRHKEAHHLRSPAIDLPWYQYLLLDLIGFVLGVTFILIFVTYKVVLLSIKIGKKYMVR